MTTELATTDGEVIEEAQYQPVTLYGTTDPVAIVERASTLATALSDVIRSKHLFKQISGRNHVLVEGWTLLGSMLGVFAEVEWTRPTDNGWEARAVARTLNGKIVGAAEAMCTRSERTWSSRDEYALRSMAQTRAVSKALRLPLGYIIELAGYSATPAEEIPEHDEASARQQTAAARSTSARTVEPRNRGEAQQAIADAAHAKGWNISKVDQLAKDIGIKRGDATLEQLIQLLRAVEQPGEQAQASEALPAEPATTPATTPGSSVPTDSPATDAPASGGTQTSEIPTDGGLDADVVAPEGVPPSSSGAPTLEDVLAVSGGELVPPKPGSDEYRSLSAMEKSQARAYWARAQPQGARETHEPTQVGAAL